MQGSHRLRQGCGESRRSGFAAEADHFDVLAIGAGPAGATAAHLLARWGYRVVFVDRALSRDEGPALSGVEGPALSEVEGPALSGVEGLAESLPPSAVRLFQRFDLADVLTGRHVLRSTGNTSWWGSREPRSETFDHPGCQIHRPGFDRALAARARASGAVARRGVSIKELHTAGDHVEIAWQSATGRKGEWRVRFVLDCSGRAGVVARRGFRRPPLYHTQALIGFWRHRNGFPLPASGDPSHTLVESYDGGWAWSVPVAGGMRSVALMTSRSETTYHRELERAPRHAALVDGATLAGRTWTTDASVYDASRYGEGRVLLVGDAGSFIDPLSSFGVKKAMMSAWRAAVVVNTILREGDASRDAVDYFDRGEREVFAGSLAESRRVFGVAAAAHRDLFWLRRESTVAGVLPSALHADPEVARALRSLKTDATLQLRPSSDVRFEAIVEADGRTLVRRRAIATRAMEEPVRYVAGVELPRLFSMASSYDQVPDLYDAYNRAATPVALPDFLGALSVLIAKGALVQGSPPFKQVPR